MQIDQDEQNDAIFHELQSISYERYSATVINNIEYDFFEKYHNDQSIVKIERVLLIPCCLKDPEETFMHYEATNEGTGILVNYFEDIIRNILISHHFVKNDIEIQSIIDKARRPNANPDDFDQFKYDVKGFMNSTFGAFAKIAHPKSLVKTGFCCIFDDKANYEIKTNQYWKESLSKRQEIYRHFLRDLIIKYGQFYQVYSRGKCCKFMFSTQLDGTGFSNIEEINPKDSLGLLFERLSHMAETIRGSLNMNSFEVFTRIDNDYQEFIHECEQRTILRKGMTAYSQLTNGGNISTILDQLRKNKIVPGNQFAEMQVIQKALIFALTMRLMSEDGRGNNSKRKNPLFQIQSFPNCASSAGDFRVYTRTNIAIFICDARASLS